MASPLADLPKELRDMISKLVVYHEDSDGVIAPIPTNDHCHTYNHSAATLIGGQRVDAIHGRIVGINEPYDEPINEYSRKNEVERAEKFKATANGKHGHICSMNCLLQPGLALVSRAFRAEALPLFYTSNRFHIELASFRFCDPRNDYTEIISPVDWWRAIGDTNLRYIRHLSLVGQWTIQVDDEDDYPASRELRTDCNIYADRRSAVVTYSRDGHLVSNSGIITAVDTDTSITQLIPESRVEFPKVNRRLYARFNATSTNFMASFIQALETDGLHVQALECLVAYMEEKDTCFLPDYSALTCDVPAARDLRVIIQGKVERMEDIRRRKRRYSFLLRDTPVVAPSRALRRFDLPARGIYG